MANTTQARKRAHQAVVQNAHNSVLRSRLCTTTKGIRKAVTAGDKTAAAATFKAAQNTIDSIVDEKIVRKDKTTHAKSRLFAAIKAMAV